MSHSRKLIVPALAALGLFGFMSLGASAGPTGDGGVVIDSGQLIPYQVADRGDRKNNPHSGHVGGGGEDDKNNPPPGPVGGGGEDDKNDPPPEKPQHPPMGGGNDGENNPPPDGGKNNPPPQSPPSPPAVGMGKENFDFGFGHVRRKFTCYNGYQTVMVRDIRECRFVIHRRVAVSGGYRGNHARGAYAYGGGYSYGGGFATGGGYSYGGGYATDDAYSYGGGYATGGSYVYQQPIVRYYRPASRAAVMQAEKRARRAAQYNYGSGYGYDNGGQVGGGYAAGGYVGGYGYDNGGYPAGYGAQLGYGDGLGSGYGHKAKRGHRRHKQVYGMMGGYGYDAGFGVGFGYGGTVVHYGPIITKDGAY